MNLIKIPDLKRKYKSGKYSKSGESIYNQHNSQSQSYP